MNTETTFQKSESIDQIFMALSKAQASLKPALKNKTNPYFQSKYADLDSCMEALKDPLSKNDLCITQLPSQNEGNLSVTTVLGHKSGQWIMSQITMRPEKNTPQGIGSAITYARRYGLAITGLVTEDDDDGNDASGKDNKNKPKPPPPKPKNHAPTKEDLQEPSSLTAKQIQRMQAIVASSEWTIDQVKEVIASKFKKKSSKELSVKEYNELIDIIQKQIP